MQFAFIIITVLELYGIGYSCFGLASNWVLTVRQAKDAMNIGSHSFSREQLF